MMSMVTLALPVEADGIVLGFVSADFSLEFLESVVAKNAPDTGVEK